MVHFWYLPLTNILMWAVSHALNVDIQQYVWPIIWNLIKKAEESYKNLSCVCTLDRCEPFGTNHIKLAKPNQSGRRFAFKMFCSVAKSRRGLDKLCNSIVESLCELGTKKWGHVSLMVAN